MKVYFSYLAQNDLLQLLDYFRQEWSQKVVDLFLAKLKMMIEQISADPESCPKSIKFGGIYKCVITEQTTLFYRVNFIENEIEVITLFDNRQDPNKLQKIIQ